MQIFVVMKASDWCTKIQGPILVVTQPGFANQLHKEADLNLYTDVYASVCVRFWMWILMNYCVNVNKCVGGGHCCHLPLKSNFISHYTLATTTGGKELGLIHVTEPQTDWTHSLVFILFL